MPDNPSADVPLEFLLDETKLREKYRQAIDSGASEEFAKSYVEEIARSMVVEEAMSISLRPEGLRGVLDRAIFKA